MTSCCCSASSTTRAEEAADRGGIASSQSLQPLMQRDAIPHLEPQRDSPDSAASCNENDDKVLEGCFQAVLIKAKNESLNTSTSSRFLKIP